MLRVSGVQRREQPKGVVSSGLGSVSGPTFFANNPVIGFCALSLSRRQMGRAYVSRLAFPGVAGACSEPPDHVLWLDTPRLRVPALFFAAPDAGEGRNCRLSQISFSFAHISFSFAFHFQRRGRCLCTATEMPCCCSTSARWPRCTPAICGCTCSRLKFRERNTIG